VGVVAGTGGLGKSQLAIEYAHRFGPPYPGGVYWVDADRGVTTLITQISEAARLAVDPKAEESAQLEQVWRQMNQRPPALVVLDNFPETEPMRPYLPTTGRVHTLVTTRRRDLTNYPHVLLGTLSVEEGAQLLNSGNRTFGAEARELAERLGGLPLALELAKSFLNYRADLSIAAVLAEMRRAGEMEVLQEFAAQYRDELPSRHELDVASTFALAPPPAKDILRGMAELAPVPVPRTVLRKMVDAPQQPGLQDPFDQSISELARLSLVELAGSREAAAAALSV
jgi:hypothetical protein